MLGTAAKAFQAGFNVVRLNLRTCGGTETLTKTIYHSGMSWDLRAVINELISRDKLQNIFLAGFSLGGNMSLKLAGELGANAPAELHGVAAVSPSIDLAACAAAIERRSNWLYQQRFISSLKKRMRHIQKLYPELYNTNGLKEIRTIRDFDSRFTAIHGGFRDVDDYYARSSALQFIKDIRVPTLIIHAQDDPFVPYEPFCRSSLAENPFVTLLAPPNGGHVGFVSDSRDDERRFWAEHKIVEFCRLLDAKTGQNMER
jgi:predicted alpha/beta-fold hydrolase